MRKMRNVAAGMLVMGLLLGSSQPVMAADQTPEQQIEELQKENEGLREQVETLTKELEELKGTEETEEKIELPDHVANADTSVQYSDQATVKLVQETLNAAGYNCGTPDGVAGKKTTEQINAYETAQGLTVNGVITDQLLESLGIADQLEEQAKAEADKASYSSEYTYEQLARNPDTYTGKKVKFSGKILQVMEGKISYLRVAMNSNYDTVIFVTYEKDELSYRLLEDDLVTIYGSSLGVYSYEAVSGATITLPWIMATYVDLQ